LLGVALSGTVDVIFSMVETDTIGVVIGSCAVILFVGVWLAFPIVLRRHGKTQRDVSNG
jgi:hypothetical protein